MLGSLRREELESLVDANAPEAQKEGSGVAERSALCLL
jgi:hypothetical protein